MDNGHLGCFYIMEIVKNAEMNKLLLMFFQISVLGFFRYIPRVGITGSKGRSIFKFWCISILFSIVDALVCIPTNSGKGSLFSTSSPTLVVCCFIKDSHSDRCEVISIVVLIYISLMVTDDELSVQVLCLFFNWAVVQKKKEHFKSFDKWLPMCYYCFTFYFHSSKLSPDYFHYCENCLLNDVSKDMRSEAWVWSQGFWSFLELTLDFSVKPVVQTTTFWHCQQSETFHSVSCFWIFTKDSDSLWENLFTLGWGMSPNWGQNYTDCIEVGRDSLP